MIPVVLGVTFLVFIIMDLAPGDPVLLILGDNASEEARIEKTHELGLDEPVIIRFGKYVYNFFFNKKMVALVKIFLNNYLINTVRC